MRIVQLAPIWIPIPPPGYGGIERIVYDLTEQFVKDGHEVIVYAARGSHTSGTLIEYPEGINSDDWMKNFVTQTLPGSVDIIHDHSLLSSVGRLGLSTPTVCSVHLPACNPVQYPVYVSRFLLEHIGQNRGTYIHNGLNPDDYQFSETKQDYLLFLGRLIREKGIMEALDLADQTGERLLLAGPIPDEPLFREEIAPRLHRNPRIEYVGEVGGQRRQDILKQAKGVIVPSLWGEPFGLVTIEALACGTPALALANGAFPEILSGLPDLLCHPGAV